MLHRPRAENKPPKQMWVLIPIGENSRLTKLTEKFSREIAKIGHVEIRTIGVLPDNISPEGIQSREDWKKILPADMRNLSPPDIIFARKWLLLPPKEILPHTFRIVGEATIDPLPDAIVSIEDGADFLKASKIPKRLHSYMHFYPPAACDYDANEYAAACREVASSRLQGHGETIAVFIGNVHDPDKLKIIADAAKQRHATLLVSGSKRTTAKDWQQIKEAFEGINTTFYWAWSADPQEATAENPRYRFLAQADKIVNIDSGSMATEHAHTGKPVYAERSIIFRYDLEPNVLPLTEQTTWEEKALPKLDVAGDMARHVLYMHNRFLRSHRGCPSKAWSQSVATPAEATIQV